MCSWFCEIGSKINIDPNDLKLFLLDLSCDVLHLKIWIPTLLSCVFIYRLICARLFKCILNYILIQQNVKQSLLDSFRFTFQNCNLYSWEVFIFYFLKCISYLLLENWEMSSKLQKNNKMAKTIFSSFVFFVYNKRK